MRLWRESIPPSLFFNSHILVQTIPGLPNITCIKRCSKVSADVLADRSQIQSNPIPHLLPFGLNVEFIMLKLMIRLFYNAPPRQCSA